MEVGIFYGNVADKEHRWKLERAINAFLIGKKIASAQAIQCGRCNCAVFIWLGEDSQDSKITKYLQNISETLEKIGKSEA